MAEDKAVSENEIESNIIEVMSNYPKGLSAELLKEAIPSITLQQLNETLNKLLTEHKIELLQKGKKLAFKLKDSSAAQKYQGSDIEEKIIFEAIGRAGDNGVTPKDLKIKCNLAQQQVNKILKNLESKRLIKSVNSTSRRKIFILYDLEPSHTITGGTFYSGTEFETEFVDVLADQCYKYLAKTKAVAEKICDPIARKNASYNSSKVICDYINSLKISKIKLNLTDIEQILESLIYDDKIEKFVSMSKTSSSKSATENLYRVSQPLVKSAGLMMVPCGVCPVYENCCTDGDISPSTCVYMKEWLKF